MSRVLASYADEAERTGLQVRVQSSNLYAVWYQADFNRLFVWFGGNEKTPLITRYAYEDVSEAVYGGLLGASSKGIYLTEKIKKAGYAYSGPF